VQDAQLIKKCLAGDTDSFGVLVQRHQDAVLGYASHRLGDPLAAQDVAQEVFIEAYARLSDLRQPEKLAAWLRGIALNYCRRWLRQRQAERQREDAAGRQLMPATISDPQTELEAQQRRERIESLLDALSEKNRLTARLYYLEDLSYEEIARFFEVPLSTVKGRLHKARKKLKEEMIDMAKEAHASDGPQEEFAAQVMKRVGIAEIGIGEQRGTIWFSTADDRVFALSLPSEQAHRLAAGPKPKHQSQQGQGIALATTAADLPVASEQPDMYGLVAQLKDRCNIEIVSLVLDAEEGRATAEAIVGYGESATRLTLSPCDAVGLAGRLDLPLHATTRALEAVSLADVTLAQIHRDALFRLAKESGRLHAATTAGRFVLKPRLENGDLIVDIEQAER